MRDKGICKILVILIVSVLVTSGITLCIAFVDDSMDNIGYLNKFELYSTPEDRIFAVNNIKCTSLSSADEAVTSDNIKLYLFNFNNLSEYPNPAQTRYVQKGYGDWTWGNYFLKGDINGTSYSYRLYLGSDSSTTFKVEIIINGTTVASFPLLTVPHDPDYQPFSGNVTGLDPTTSRGDEVTLKITKISGSRGGIKSGGAASFITIPPLPPGPIQSMIDAAKPGNTIIIDDGIYNENVKVNKKLMIRSENGSANCIVQAVTPTAPVFEVTADYVNISGFTVKGATGDYPYYKAGIYLNRVCRCNISNNILNNDYGIYLEYSNSNKLTGNIMVENGIDINGTSLSDYTNEIDESNTVNGEPVYYWKDAKGRRIPDGAGQIILVNCTNIAIKNQILNNVGVGIKVAFSSDITIINNNCSNNRDDGIYLYKSNNSRISNNNCSNNRDDGIFFFYSSNNSISNNSCSYNGYGIYLKRSNNNIIANSNCSNNSDDGIHLFWDSNNNSIANSNCSNNKGDGIFLRDSNNNSIANSNCSNNNDDGIFLRDSNNNSIANSNCSNNKGDGIFLLDSNNNSIANSNCSDNHGNGIYLRDTTDNHIYLNNFINNSDNVDSYESTNNTWNSKEKITYNYTGSTYTNYLGNHWDDYKENYPDAEEIDECGIGDTPYNIDGGKDNYPLMMRFEDYITPTPANVVIWYAHYDAAGNDHYNLNDEYIVLKNICGTSINLGRWVMKDKENHTYIFPSFELQPGATVTIRTGSGTDTATDLYWGSKRAIWNNKGDTVYLYDANKNLVDTKSW